MNRASDETRITSDTTSQHSCDNEGELCFGDADLDAASDRAFFDSSHDDFYTTPTVEYVPSTLSILLGIFSPGTFLTVGDKPQYGIGLNLGLTAVSFILCLMCIWLDLYPVPVFVGIVIIIVSVWIYGIAAVIRRPPHIRPITPWAQAGIAFLSFWLPFILSFFIETNFMLQRTWMSNDNMNPGILQGDVILVDRLAFFRTEPTYGDLVFIEEQPSEGSVRRRAFFGRIIACGGDEIQLHGAHPIVNGTKLSQYIHQIDNNYENYERTLFELPYKTDESDSLDEPEHWYPIRMPQELLFSQTNSVKLDKDYYYVLEDNRTSGMGHVRTSYGFIVHRSEIHGRPKYILYNTESESRMSRYGLAIR